MTTLLCLPLRAVVVVPCWVSVVDVEEIGKEIGKKIGK
jgi:hypothetical protein